MLHFMYYMLQAKLKQINNNNNSYKNTPKQFVNFTDQITFFDFLSLENIKLVTVVKQMVKASPRQSVLKIHKVKHVANRSNSLYTSFSS